MEGIQPPVSILMEAEKQLHWASYTLTGVLQQPRPPPQQTHPEIPTL